jgi:flagellar motor switch protein FliM
VKYEGGATAKNLLKRHLQDTELNVNVEFGQSVISFQELQELKVGDIIVMENRIGSEVAVNIDHKKIFYGSPGEVNNHKAVKINRKVESKE